MARPLFNLALSLASIISDRTALSSHDEQGNFIPAPLYLRVEPAPDSAGVVI